MATSGKDSSGSINVTQKELDDAYGRFSAAVKDDRPVSLRDYKLSLWKYNGFLPYDTGTKPSEQSKRINEIESVSNTYAVVRTTEKTFDINDKAIRDEGEDDNDDAIEKPPQTKADATHKRKEVPSEQRHDDAKNVKKCKASNNSRSQLKTTNAISTAERVTGKLHDRPTSTSKIAELQNEPVYRQPTGIETALFNVNSKVNITTNEMLCHLKAGIEIVDGSDLMQDRIINAFIAQLKTNLPEHSISEEDPVLSHKPTNDNENTLDIELFNRGEYLVERGNKILKNLRDVTNILARSVVGDESTIQQFFQTVSKAQYEYFEMRHWSDFQECASFSNSHISQNWLQFVNK